MAENQETSGKAFGLWSAVALGIGSMVGAGIFIVIGEAGAIAGNLVTASFLVSGIIALLCGYSLSKLAIRYPSRGGIIEYLVQSYGEGVFSGTLGVLFYFAQLVALAAVAKSFGIYGATYVHTANGGPLVANLFAVGVLLLFVLVNLLGAALVARSENIIVVVKITALVLFAAAAMFFVQPANLAVGKAFGLSRVFYSLGLTFFAFQGFSIITNSVEDMDRPGRNMLRSMYWAIGLVAVLYIAVSVAVFGNLPLTEIIKDKDFALAQAAKPAFGAWGFRIIAATALLATASAINATLYSVTQISFTLAKAGDLPREYEFHIFHNTAGLVISALLILPMIVFLDLGQIAGIASIAVLLIQGFTHTGHLLKHQETGGNIWLIGAAALGCFGAAGFAVIYTSRSMPHIVYDILGLFLLAFAFEILMRLFTSRAVRRQVVAEVEALEKELFQRQHP